MSQPECSFEFCPERLLEFCFDMLIRLEYMVTFSLADPAYMHHQTDTRGLMIRFFRPNINDIPLPQVGDVVVLRNVKVSNGSVHSLVVTDGLRNNRSMEVLSFCLTTVPASASLLRSMFRTLVMRSSIKAVNSPSNLSASQRISLLPCPNNCMRCG